MLLVVLDYFTASSSLVQIRGAHSYASLAASTSETSALISVPDEETFLLLLDFQSCCLRGVLGNKVFSRRIVPGVKSLRFFLLFTCIFLTCDSPAHPKAHTLTGRAASLCVLILPALVTSVWVLEKKLTIRL